MEDQSNGLDVGALRAFAQGAEELGYHHLVAFDSVFTDYPYHEPLALFALLAGCTKQIELVTGVIVAPSRQTLLLAKDAWRGRNETAPAQKGGERSTLRVFLLPMD